MNWDAIGAISEAIGALAVAATLIFLIVQVRQNSKAVNATVTHGSITAFNDLNSILATNPRLAEVLDRGNANPDQLSDEERYAYTWLARSYLNLFQNLYDLFLDGTCPSRLWMRNAVELQAALKWPGFKRFLEIDSSFSELLAYINSLPPTPEYKFEVQIQNEGTQRADA